MTTPLRIVLIGPPGVGKGTQAFLLVQKYGARQLSSGDIFRKEIDTGTEIGRLAQSFMAKGELVPSEITIEMMANRLRTEDIQVHGFILDGFPRSLQQAESLDALLDKMNIRLEAVISIDVPDEIVVKRLGGRTTCPKCGETYHAVSKPPKEAGLCDKCGCELVVREDDKPETIRERLKVFHKNTKPVIAHYENKGNLIHINGEGSPEEVFSCITSRLS